MATTAGQTKAEFAKRLAEAGYEDFLILDHETAATVLTEKRRELLDTILTEDVESITDIAGRVDRDVAAVHRDLDMLFRNSLVKYDTEGGRKIPRSKHEHVFVEPLF